MKILDFCWGVVGDSRQKCCQNTDLSESLFTQSSFFVTKTEQKQNKFTMLSQKCIVSQILLCNPENISQDFHKLPEKSL